MRIVIMGTGPFAVPTAQMLLDDGHDIPLVVTRPTANPQAKKQPSRPVFDWAVVNGIEVFEPQSINEPAAIERLSALGADLFFVCDYGQILSNDCLAAAKLGGINLHGSVLPRHRGAAPVQWALLRGDTVAGITVIHMTPRLDAGPALVVSQIDVAADENAGELEPRLAQLGVQATQQSVEMLGGWDGTSVIGTVQDRSLVTKAPRFHKSHGQLDFRLPAEYLVRLIRACQPWPGTFAELTWGTQESGKKIRVIVRAARALHTATAQYLGVDGSRLAPGAAATVELPSSEELDAAPQAVRDDLAAYDWSGCWTKTLAASTPQGVLVIGRIQPAGKREMDAAEFLRGHPVDATTRFELPSTEIQPLT